MSKTVAIHGAKLSDKVIQERNGSGESGITPTKSESLDEKSGIPYKNDPLEPNGYKLDGQVSKGEGELIIPEKYSKLGWFKLAICLIVTAIALGSLSIPSAFATLGMVAGVIITVGFGFIAIYTSIIVGQTKIKYPQAHDYPTAVGMIWGRFGQELAAVMYVLVLVLTLGSHTLTGTIAFVQLAQKPDFCALVFGIISAIVLFLCALPPSFNEFAWLGYIDFASIIIAIGITIIATGHSAETQIGGVAASGWSAWPAPGTSLADGFLAVTDIVFAYSFVFGQFTFMDEMHTPKDYIKSVWLLGITEIIIYTLTGGLVYAFVGPSVSSPAILSTGLLVSRVAFGVALPVIFISGSINCTIMARYIMNQLFKNSQIRYINTFRGWVVWITIVGVLTIIAWAVAEAIPFFNALLGLISSLFISGFTLYFPALFWFILLKEGKWNANRKNILLSIVNGCVFIMGLLVLGLGTYASVEDILTSYSDGSVRSPFTCASKSYVS